MTTAEYKPDSPIYAARTPTPGPLLDPERAEIQARTPDPVTYSLTDRPHTASPDQHGAPHTETDPTTVSVTPTPMLDDYDVQDFNDSHKVESVPVRGDVLVPMQLPPLPTTRSQPAHLDISHGGEEGDQRGSGRGESSGSGSGEGGSGDDSSSRDGVTPTQVWVETTLRPSLLLESTAASEQEVKTTSRASDLPEISSERVTPGPGLGIETTSRSSHLLDITTEVVIPEIHTPESGLPAVAGEVGQQPAVVFKEDVTPGTTLTFDLDQSPAIPIHGESAKPPFHLIIVNVHDQNQSGELRWGHTLGLYLSQIVPGLFQSESVNVDSQQMKLYCLKKSDLKSSALNAASFHKDFF